MIGPGKYDHLATYVREASKAEAVILIILGGDKGSGFSVQSTTKLASDQLASLLRQVADIIEYEPGEKEKLQ